MSRFPSTGIEKANASFKGIDWSHCGSQVLDAEEHGTLGRNFSDSCEKNSFQISLSPNTPRDATGFCAFDRCDGKTPIRGGVMKDFLVPAQPPL